MSNTTSYSLYVRLGFRHVETCLNFSGVIDTTNCPNPGADRAAGAYYRLRKLAQGDVGRCNEMFQSVHDVEKTIWSRSGEIEDMIAKGGETAFALERTRGRAAGSIGAFTTGTVLGGFIVADDEEVRLHFA